MALKMQQVATTVESIGSRTSRFAAGDRGLVRSTDFQDVLDRKKTVRLLERGQFQFAERAFSDFVRQWDVALEKKMKHLSELSPQSRELLELQFLVNKLHLQSLLATKAGETLSSTMKRVQQMGSS